MTSEQIRMKAVGMDTPALANWLINLADEKRSLRGNLQDNIQNAERNHEIERYIRILAAELTSRQMPLKGF